MIAEDGKHASGSSKRLQFAGDLFGRDELSADNALDDEVAKDADDIWACRVGAHDDVVQFRGTVEWRADMQIGEDRDANRAVRRPGKDEGFFFDCETRRFPPERAESRCYERQ